MKHRSLLVSATILFASATLPASASDISGLAPADEYFGRFQLSILGIANTIRDADAKLDAGADAATVIEGPLAFASDAIADWEQRYPHDPWIAKDLLALQRAYAKAPTVAGRELAAKTEAWLVKDFGEAAVPKPRQRTAWERFAAMRAGYPAR